MYEAGVHQTSCLQSASQPHLAILLGAQSAFHVCGQYMLFACKDVIHAAGSGHPGSLPRASA